MSPFINQFYCSNNKWLCQGHTNKPLYSSIFFLEHISAAPSLMKNNRNILFRLLGWRTIVSDSKTRDIRLDKRKLYLLRQKHPEQFVNNGIMKAKECDKKNVTLHYTKINWQGRTTFSCKILIRGILTLIPLYFS